MTKTIRGGKSPGFDYDGRRAYNRRASVAQGSRLKRLTNRSERRREPQLAHNELQLLAIEKELDQRDLFYAMCDYDDYM